MSRDLTGLERPFVCGTEVEQREEDVVESRCSVGSLLVEERDYHRVVRPDHK